MEYTLSSVIADILLESSEGDFIFTWNALCYHSSISWWPWWRTLLHRAKLLTWITPIILNHTNLPNRKKFTIKLLLLLIWNDDWRNIFLGVDASEGNKHVFWVYQNYMNNKSGNIISQLNLIRSVKLNKATHHRRCLLSFSVGHEINRTQWKLLLAN